MSNLRILIADADSAFRANAEKALSRQGYDVVPAASSDDALTRLAQDPIDVVLAEVALPPQSGLDVLRAAQAHAPSLPVILLADSRMISVAARGVREGAFDYVLKPIDDFTRLSALINRVARKNGTSAATPPPERPVEPSAGDSVGARFLAAATQGQDLPQLLSLYAAELDELAHAHQSLVLLTPENGQLQLAAFHGFDDRAEATRFYGSSNLEDLGWRVMEARDLVWQTASLSTNEMDAEVQELLGLPLVYAGQMLGVTMILVTRPRNVVPDATLDALKRLTQQASLAVELAWARELADRRNPSDRVTGLYARNHFFELADREFRRSWRFGEPIAALELDVDDYSRIQMLLGSSSGDQVMQQIAQSIRPRLRSIDLVGRLDADKLGILILMGTRDMALSVGERLRRAVAEIELPTADGTWQVTASIGMANYPREQCASVHDLFALASQATRAAKRAGRNRVVGV